jgi:hypothetical protein
MPVDYSVSVLLPTRGRPDSARRFMKSALDLASRPDQIEVVLCVDDDDPASHDLDQPGLSVTRMIGPRRSMGSYNSECLKASSGKVVLLANDDMVIRTRGWDGVIRDLDARFPDGVYLGYGNDLFKGARVCTFPILSRIACDIVGDPFPVEYQGAFIDTHLMDIFKRLERIGETRLVYLDHLILEHMHYRTGKSQKDKTYTDRNRFGDDEVFLRLRDRRSAAMHALADAIASFNGGKGRWPGSSKTPVAPADAAGLARFFPLAYARIFLLDHELTRGWRVSLFLSFCARHIASRILARFSRPAAGRA